MSTCSIISQQQTEPLAGTAATATTWLLIEQSGPWGAKALTESRLDPDLGQALERAAAGTGVRVALIRRPGRQPSQQPGAGRAHRVFVAHTRPGRSWVRTTLLTNPEPLGGLDMVALGAGDHGQLWAPHRGDPLTLVCTNGKRDRCCALLGRPLAEELTVGGVAEVWEITHLGGHRFSPTLLVLPYGYAYGRMSAHQVKGVLEGVRDGQVLTEGCRGRSCWDRPGQAAELAVRQLVDEHRVDALTVTEPAGNGPHWTVTVAHQDGRAWRVAVSADTSAEPAPSSCDAEPAVIPRMTISQLAALPTGG